jgi:uncharacterized protein (TIGR02453 family)
MKSSSSTFKGFPIEGMAFLRELKENNNREWFNPRLDRYKQLVREPMLELVHALHIAMLGFAPAYVGDPAKCVYRIYRDTRFSKDKTPYKTSSEALFWRNNLDKNSGGGFYIAISPEQVGVGGGLYMAEPAALLAVRQHIAANAAAFHSTFESKAVRRVMGELKGEQTKRVPKGFAGDHPSADLLRRKNYVLYETLDPQIATSPKLFREIVTRLEAVTPFVEFLDTPLARRR